MGEFLRRLLRASACCALMSCFILPAATAHAQEPQVDAAALSQAAQSAVGQLQGVKLGAQGATVTVGGEEVGLDISGLTGGGGSPGSGGSNYMGLGMLFFGASVLTRLLSTISRIIRPRRSRERWIEA